VLASHPELLLVPATVVASLILAFNLLGDALNDVFTSKAQRYKLRHNVRLCVARRRQLVILGWYDGFRHSFERPLRRSSACTGGSKHRRRGWRLLESFD
jgi:hypothetical protein